MLADAPPLRVIHGSPASPWQPIYPHAPTDEVSLMLSGVEETTIVTAHTHISMDETVGRWHIMNPGSVGVPLDGVLAASYMLMEGTPGGWRTDLRRVSFDYEPLFREFERQGFVEECGVTGHLVVEEFRTALPRVHPFLNWRKCHYPQEAFTRELLDEFARVDPLDYAAPAYRENAKQQPGKEQLR